MFYKPEARASDLDGDPFVPTRTSLPQTRLGPGRLTSPCPVPRASVPRTPSSPRPRRPPAQDLVAAGISDPRLVFAHRPGIRCLPVPTGHRTRLLFCWALLLSVGITDSIHSTAAPWPGALQIQVFIFQRPEMEFKSRIKMVVNGNCGFSRRPSQRAWAVSPMPPGNGHLDISAISQLVPSTLMLRVHAVVSLGLPLQDPASPAAILCAAQLLS